MAQSADGWRGDIFFADSLALQGAGVQQWLSDESHSGFGSLPVRQKPLDLMKLGTRDKREVNMARQLGEIEHKRVKSVS